MTWPYEFITLTDDQKHQRRLSIDYYAYIAHISAFAPALFFLFIRLIRRLRRRSPYQQVPSSPAAKAAHRSWISSRWPVALWWLGEDVYLAGAHWGRRDEWVFGSAWLLWLLVLCVRGTGKGEFWCILEGGFF